MRKYKSQTELSPIKKRKIANMLPDESLLKSKQMMQYFYASQELKSLMQGDRHKVVKSIDAIINNHSLAKSFCEELWYSKVNSESNNAGSNGGIYTGADVPTFALTKNGELQQTYAMAVLKNLENDFILEDEYPIMIGSSKIQKILDAPKKIVAQMYLNAVEKHNRPCFLIRNLLTCEIDDKVYLMVSDEKFYQNSPAVNFPLALLVSGKPYGICQLSRIDAVGILAPNSSQSLGIANKKTKLPRYIVSKFHTSHHNALPAKGNYKYGMKKVSAASHMHERDELFETMYALSYMVKVCSTKGDPKQFLKFNAREICDIEFYTSFSTPVNVGEKMKNDAMNNSSVISTRAMRNYYARTYNITNYELDNKFSKQLDRFRVFNPDRTAVIVDTAEITAPQDVLLVAPSDDNMLEQKCRARENEIIDIAYVQENSKQYSHTQQRNKAQKIR